MWSTCYCPNCVNFLRNPGEKYKECKLPEKFSAPSADDESAFRSPGLKFLSFLGPSGQSGPSGKLVVSSFKNGGWGTDTDKFELNLFWLSWPDYDIILIESIFLLKDKTTISP